MLTYILLKDGKYCAFPVQTPKDNFLSSAKARLDKDFEYKELNKNTRRRRRIFFSSLNYKITEILTLTDFT